METGDVGGQVVVGQEEEEVCGGKGETCGGCPYCWQGDEFARMLGHHRSRCGGVMVAEEVEVVAVEEKMKRLAIEKKIGEANFL